MTNNIIKKEKVVIYSPYQAGIREIISPIFEVEIETRKNGEKIILLDYKEIKEEKI